MSRWFALAWKLRLVGVLLVVGLGVLGWMERSRLLTWYYLQRLDRAAEGEADTWVGRIVALDRAAVPGLLGSLHSDRPSLAEGIQRSLTQLAQMDGPAGAAAIYVIGEAAKQFANLAKSGKCCVLDIAAAISTQVDASPPPLFCQAMAALVNQARRDTDAAVRACALTVVEKWPTCPAGDVEVALRELTKHCLKDDCPANRAQAVRLAARPGSGLNGQIITALHDPAAEVRREAMAAAGPLEDVIATEELLQWLHDPDAEVARRCEIALREQRHLQEHHLKMGRLLTDPRPTVRLRVLDFLNVHSDLEPGVWLRRLSHDSSPAVRAATVRALSEQTVSDLTDRLDQMAQNDPSPTIRQLARFYLSSPKGN